MKAKSVAISVFLLQVTSITALAGPAYLPPSGGWSYIYNGDSAAIGSGGFTSLDGTWSHDNGNDEWDGSQIGAGRPGGANVLTESDTTFLRIQDTGDPRDYGMGDPGSNRKITFGHDISTEGASNSILDDGVTISFRARISTGSPLDDLHPDGGGGISPWPAGGDGYLIHDSGKGNFGIYQSNGGNISFSLASMSADGLQGLIMNNLNGTALTGDVDIGDIGTLNILPLADLTDWHDFWITIESDASLTGTHLVKVYADGSLISNDFLVTAGNGNLYSGFSYIALGVGSTPQSGAIDIDYFSYTSGALAPSTIPAPGAILLGGIGTGLVGLLRRRKML